MIEKVSILADVLEEDCPWEWERAFELIDILEEKSGANVLPVVSRGKLAGFALCANERMLSMVEYSTDVSPSDLIDILGYLFFRVFGMTEAEA